MRLLIIITLFLIGIIYLLNNKIESFMNLNTTENTTENSDNNFTLLNDENICGSSDLYKGIYYDKLKYKQMWLITIDFWNIINNFIYCLFITAKK